MSNNAIKKQQKQEYQLTILLISEKILIVIIPYNNY